MHTRPNRRWFGLASLLLALMALAGAVFAARANAPSPAGKEALEESFAPSDPAADPLEAASPQQRGADGSATRGVYQSQIRPHWLPNNTQFWYRNDLRDGTKEFILVNAEKGIRQPAFDHQKLAAALSKAAGEDYPADRLPFADIEIVEDGAAVQFEAANKNWKCQLRSYECTAITPTPATPEPKAVSSDQDRRRGRSQTERDGPLASPDNKWTAFIKDHNAYIRSADEGQEFQLSQDGQEGNAYGRLEWAPDSKVLAAWRIEPGERKEVYLVQWAPPNGGRAVLKSRPYALPGDKFTRYEPSVFNATTRAQVKPAVDRFEHEWESPRLHWSRDGRRFAYEQTDRGHQRFRVIEVDTLTGTVRNLVDEKTETFIWTAHTENLNLRFVNWLEKTDEMIYVSERDGWRHLYLVDTKEGRIQCQLTKGDYVVRAIDRIDEDTRQIWFRASGKNPDQDPYLIHFYRVDFDGANLVALTAGNGNHSIQYSPDRRFIIDTYSRVDLAPLHELRRVADGALVCDLEKADIAELQARDWEAPEVFVAKGRDGTTDIWGIICRPHPFDPHKKYPVIEQIYAGPQGSFVPRTFSGTRRFSSLTDLGFVVVQMDGMGTANRSKAFHDVCWHNLKDAGFPDRILWHKAAAAKYPWYDLSRVGIYGTSAGGQSAVGALLFHPEFYKAAVANCGCHDNRLDKASWNEQWMGYPVGPHYSECSNIDHADKLEGHLFLIVGGMDDNVPTESTFRFVDALIKANKDFELLVVPAGGHGSGGAYGQRRLQDFFVRHLQGIQPPNRNARPDRMGS